MKCSLIPSLILLLVVTVVAGVSGAAGIAATQVEGSMAAAMVSTGVPRDLAAQRVGMISDLEYGLTFTIEQGARIHGSVVILFSLAGKITPLAVDFAGLDVREVRSAGTEIPFRFENEHIVLKSEHLHPGKNRIEISFTPSERPLHREKDYLYSLFVPALARYVFPCFDQPDLKARYHLTLEIPASWTAVSNTPVIEDVIKQNTRRVRFAETKPLSTYTFSFAAGEFNVETAERDGRVMNLYHLESDSAKVARNLPSIFDLHAEALRWTEEYTGIPYPFGKFDFLALPAFPYSGMEHPGAILYRAERLFLEESATERERLRRAGVISHETAHMWFGDLVTMRWFDDVWLKEAFAQFMADRIIRPAFPGVDHRLLFISSHHDALHDIERSAGTHSIRQELENLAEAGSVYGDIIYHKPPVMLNQLEKLMGEEPLRDALREYLVEYTYGNATWEELVAILDRHSEMDLVSWSNAWVMESGRPDITMRRVRNISNGWEAEEIDSSEVDRMMYEDAVGFVIEQSDPQGRGLGWAQEFSVARCAQNIVTEIDVRLDSSRVKVKTELPWIVFVLPDSRGEGFGFFELDTTDPTASYFGSLRNIDPVQRAMFARILRDNFLTGTGVDTYDYLEILKPMLRDEEIELNLQALIEYMNELFWLFLPRELYGQSWLSKKVVKGGSVILIHGGWPEGWEHRYPELILLDKIERSSSASAKSACFKGFLSIVMTDDGVETLRQTWEGEHSFEGLTLSERDYCDMALELAIREVKGWEKILDYQEKRIEDPELRKRFIFVRQAVDADPEKRDRFFASLADRENRRREPWVLEALYYLHHPLRTDSSVRYIPASLELLEEIRDTGDIFFPRDWIKATLRYHGSDGAIEAVLSFLESRPGYPVKLRWIVLQAVDIPFRAYKMHNETRRSLHR
jgi:aminopeptidase N